jgi:hypothetical protein
MYFIKWVTTIAFIIMYYGIIGFFLYIILYDLIYCGIHNWILDIIYAKRHRADELRHQPRRCPEVKHMGE